VITEQETRTRHSRRKRDVNSYHYRPKGALQITCGLLAARAVWASSWLVFIPFGLCYLWLIAISIVLIGRARAVENPQRAAQGLSVP